MEQAISRQPAKFGLVAFMLSVASLLIVIVQLSTFFEPQEKTSGSVIGEIAADIKQSAKRALEGKPAPKPAPKQRDYNQFITLAALCCAGIAIVLAGIGLYRNESRQLSYLAVSLGVSTFVVQYLFLLAMLICGVVLLGAILNNLDSIFN
ncbi:hypothetical protein A8B75_20015 [Sphingomonadales bacterium EhC05]|nr:hypothetical protein A8B75_20015 [Sphingomonadales bacterium EhC05]